METKYGEEIKQKMVELKNQGKGTNEIARELNIPLGSANYLLRVAMGIPRASKPKEAARTRFRTKRKKRAPYTQELAAQIIEMRTRGKSYHQIQRALNASNSSVARAIKGEYPKDIQVKTSSDLSLSEKIFNKIQDEVRALVRRALEESL